MPVPIRRLIVALTLCCALLAGATACGGRHVTATTGHRRGGGGRHPDQHHQRREAEARQDPLRGERGPRGRSHLPVDREALEGRQVQEGREGPQARPRSRRASRARSRTTGSRPRPRTPRATRRSPRRSPRSPRASRHSRDLPSKLRKGESTDATVSSFDDIINQVKDAGKSAGAEVKDKVPSASQLTGGWFRRTAPYAV